MLRVSQSKKLTRQQCRVQLVSQLEELHQFIPLWDELAKSASDENVFYESWMFLPAIRYLLDKDSIDQLRVVLIFGDSKLIGFFPFFERKTYNGVPLRHLASFWYSHCYLSTPLIKTGQENLCWSQFYEYVNLNRRWNFCRLSNISGEGAVYTEILKAADKAKDQVQETDQHIRFCLKQHESFQDYLRVSVGRKISKEIKRKFRRLSEQGKVTFETLEAGGDLSSWMMQFLELEAKGWKGEKQVAIINNRNDFSYFKEICETAYNQGDLYLHRLCLNGRPIAMKCAFRSVKTLFAFKIAYDEDYAATSPGLLLEYEYLQWFFNQSELDQVDSCMKPGDFMISRLWTESRIIRYLNVSSNSMISKFVLTLVPLAKRFRNLTKTADSK